MLEQIERTLREALEWPDYYVTEDRESPLGHEFREAPGQQLGNLSFSICKLDSRIDRFKLQLSVVRAATSLRVELGYNRAIF